MDKKNFEEFTDLVDDIDGYEAISMTDENGITSDFFVIDAVVIDEIKYLLIVEADYDNENEENEAILVKEVDSNDDESTYELVEDDDEFNKVLITLQENNSDYEIEI